ncbi:hypothetical protein HDU87_006204 [Geranomyces variabilis]|uniref:F-box domain-containing protein n=1 Tax=Geranomyces variabilis TaxID=109894 RepID=A0AAD5XP56_9FUNG|nr:hypothetical protein HDU87_006204 [Geranomyces variabilis]
MTTFNFQFGARSSSLFLTTFDASIPTPVLTTNSRNSDVPRNFPFSASCRSKKAYSKKAGTRSRLFQDRSESFNLEFKPISLPAELVYKPVLPAPRPKSESSILEFKPISLPVELVSKPVPPAPRPKPAPPVKLTFGTLPVELVDRIYSYFPLTEQFRIAVTLRDLPRRDKLVSDVCPLQYPMDSASKEGNTDQLDAWLARYLKSVAIAQERFPCMWYTSAAISLAMKSSNRQAVLRWWARSTLPLDECIAAVLDAKPSVWQRELIDICLLAPSSRKLPRRPLAFVLSDRNEYGHVRSRPVRRFKAIALGPGATTSITTPALHHCLGDDSRADKNENEPNQVQVQSSTSASPLVKSNVLARVPTQANGEYQSPSASSMSTGPKRRHN